MSTTSCKDFSDSFDVWPCPRAQVQLGRFCELLRAWSQQACVWMSVFGASFFFSLKQLRERGTVDSIS
jgi:hypothetical protein